MKPPWKKAQPSIKSSRYGWPQRTEHLRTTFSFDADQYEKHKEYIEDMLGHAGPTINRYDTYNLDFDFTVEYYNVARQLAALRELLNDPNLFVQADISEKNGKPMLIVEFIDELRKTQDAIEARLSHETQPRSR